MEQFFFSKNACHYLRHTFLSLHVLRVKCCLLTITVTQLFFPVSSFPAWQKTDAALAIEEVQELQQTSMSIARFLRGTGMERAILPDMH